MNAARSWAVTGVIAAAIMAAVGLATSGGAGMTRAYSGVLIAEFEVDTFVEDATGDPLPVLTDSNHGYLNLETITLPPDPCTGRPEGALPERRETFAIRFIGRRKPGPSGHLGMSPAEYLVERVIDIRPLGTAC